MKKHYDICLSDFWYGSNYGSLLSGFAAYRIFKDFGKEVLMLQKPGAASDDPEITGGHNTKFIKKYYDPEDISPALSYESLGNLNEICDCFCAGPDQIWNYGLSFHENMFLPFAAEGKKLISFSASFGHKEDRTPPEAKERIKGYLNRYSAVSVSEQFCVDILKNNYDIDAVRLADPVFCLNKQYYDSIAEGSYIKETEAYILAYILDTSAQKRDAISYYARKAGIKAVNILDGNESAWLKNKKILNLPNTVPDAGAEEFLYLIKNAEFIITDSFHGTMFSILFNKPFLAVGNHARGYERFEELLGRFGLKDRLVPDPDNISQNEKYLEPVDYTEVNRIADEEKAKTLEWIKHAADIPEDKQPASVQLWKKQMLENSEKETAGIEKTAKKETEATEKTAEKVIPAKKEALPQPKQEQKDKQTGMREHYDVGVTGCWWGANYGSVLNGYSVYKTLKKSGYSVLMIYKPNCAPDDWEINNTHNAKFIDRFYDKRDVSPILKYTQLPELNKYCDAFIAGSDQIWAYGINKIFNMSFMLNFADDDKKKLSFGTSWGQPVDYTPPEKKEYTRKLLHRFNAISLREKNGVDICRNNYGVNATVVSEPVFCLSREEYRELAAQSQFELPETKYILTYILDPAPEKRQVILDYEKLLGLPAIGVVDGDPRVAPKKRKELNLGDMPEDVGAADLIKLFDGADFVITDAFHGTAFSIIFNKKFLSFCNPKRGTIRFYELLGKYNLKDRLVENPADIPDKEKFLQEIDFDLVNKKIAEEAEFSVKWLDTQLKTPIDEMKSVVLPQNTVADKNIMCTGCGACANLCHFEAISMQQDSEGFRKPVVDYDKCTGCGICASKCPVLNPKYSNNTDPACNAFMAEDEIRAVSSSGGAFTVAAEYILNQGGYVAGTVYNADFSVRHTIIADKEKLDCMRGSKYMQSDTGNVYSEVKKLLEKNELVLFTGLPCQVAGLYAVLGDKKYENLYTIDLVCHGITSQKVFDKYHQDVLGGKQLTDLQFKAKQPWGWHSGMNARFEDGTAYSVPFEKDPYFIAYLHNISKNKTCGECLFNKLPRQADLSIGDFWGINRFNSIYNDGKGTSEILVNNSKGLELLEKMRPAAKLMEPVPVNYALDGNTVMRRPYGMHKNRDYFFKHLDEENFAELTNACSKNDFRSKDEKNLAELEKNLHGIYYLAKAAALNCHGRRIVTWGQGYEFSRILKEYFGLSVEFIVYQKQKVNGTTVRMISEIKGKNLEYYFVSLERAFDAEAQKIMADYGYKIEKDYIFRVPKPVVIDNFDLSKGGYSDIYGNTVTGSSGIIKRIVFRGLNNKIVIGKNVRISSKIEFDMGTNGSVTIEDGTVFANDFKFDLFETGNMSSTVLIGKRCHFQNGLIRLFAHTRNSTVLINDGCTFENNLHLHANYGKKLIIGKDCLFSHDIDVWAGDGHPVFDVRTGRNTNSDYDNLPSYKNAVVFGDHVWVSKRAFILAGTNIGTGSIIGAQSVVKGKFPNNCSIAGSPAKIVNRDVSWNRHMFATNINQCSSMGYVRLTNFANSPVAAQNILVVGGTRFMGVKLVEELLRWGNNVTIATRGNQPDQFGNRVSRIKMDVTIPESVANALNGKYYDVVFDNLAYYSEYVRNLLNCVKCGRYIQLSSMEVYYPAKGWLTEDKFNPYTVKHEWNNKSNAGYVGGKRQAEATVYQKYPGISAVTVRIPYVTKTERLLYYCKNVVNQTPMAIKDVNRGLAFVRSEEVGRFLPWIAAQNFGGPINLSSTGFITIKEILDYIERKTGKKAIIDMEKGEAAPFNVFKEEGIAIDVRKAETLGWQSSELKDWFWKLLDEDIAWAMRTAK